MEKLLAVLKFTFSRLVFKNLAPVKSQSENMEDDKFTSEKSVSFKEHLSNFVFINFVPKKLE
nr:hypothetical protein [Marinifilum fragile]